ncbi:uncharacterized protein ALTATR162_LOCUS9181 [Alternaria atra]|uniref:Uncharacterized protein n=1 Tax=Alternaria atra TaxID=119953 RepID=A0A8J2N2Z8_9PLEO|nr:uncharacterized protein ALTATR162_LOCUS9181 [Alternaria atra]CAG5179356.1 unnamed protein product [Alternaria atra]
MRSFIVMAIVALFAFASAMPISPSAPRLQKRAEQFRLQGLREFEIAEKLSASASSSDVDPWRIRLNNKFHALFDPTSTDDEENPFDDEQEDFSGDVAPGSLESPQVLPKASEEDGFFDKLCAMFHRAESSFGYEGKELELRRPEGIRDWKRSYGGFRRR